MLLDFGVIRQLQVYKKNTAIIISIIILCLAPQLVHHGNIDFLVSDYLSEITMSLLTAAKQKQPVNKITYPALV